MTSEQKPWDKLTLEQFINHVLWESIMEGTAHCGWTDRARDGFLNNVIESVKFALDQKYDPKALEQAQATIADLQRQNKIMREALSEIHSGVNGTYAMKIAKDALNEVGK